MKLKVGFVGMGWWGRQLLKYFSEIPEVCVTAICDKYIDNVRKEIDLNGLSQYAEAEHMLNEESLDAVVIATPPPFHANVAVLAAGKGVHVFCEKPMAASVKDCNAMIKASDENNTLLMIAYKHRYAKAFQTLKNRSLKFGNPLWAMYTYPLWKVDDPGWKFKRDGTDGIIMENMVHAIDALIYLIGDVESVCAEGNSVVFKHEDVPDSSIFTLRFQNGAIAAIGGGCTSDQRISREYLDIHYARAVAQISGMLDYPYDLRLIEREKGEVEQYRFDQSDGVREEIRYFTDCLLFKQKPISGGHEGKKATQVAAAVLESIRTGKRSYIQE